MQYTSKEAEPANTHGTLYGTQTQLSLRNFGSPGRRIADVPSLIRMYALIKRAAATANRTLGVLDDRRADAIIAACDEVAAGLHTEQFPTALVLGGGGTTTNMNVNEVIAARAAQLASITVHPNDHVNASQSTNDSFPTAMALTIIEVAEGPLAALRGLSETLKDKAAEYNETPYLGRTCLQDAVSVQAGRTLRAQARAVERGADELEATVRELSAVPLGATVLGTSIGAPEGFTDACVSELAKLVDFDVVGARDLFDALAHLDPYAAVADATARAAITVAKIASDLRLRSSGPRGGLAEVTIPALQAGSSIMPAKVNPVVPEYAMQLSYRIRGSANTVSCAVAAGELELNVMEPIIIDALLTMFEDLERAAASMATLCVAGLEWDGPRRAENLGQALDRWVELAGRSGYEAASSSARQAWGHAD
ncbi:aspartate ammonia-lyase [Streptomyces phaeolivaceus]|uniref:Aspartate ammonia-lyase n=1 Tax=Streptomyces phaeolivaceus TaxID=2653200 RepID=A0A5P8KG61_9ACTN|nr:lyase family protein [Streptomyces phaeolivaceus]QFR01618.1 aspartate ammonia-lyase [Streptomyces phaeolivaceus]